MPQQSASSLFVSQKRKEINWEGGCSFKEGFGNNDQELQNTSLCVQWGFAPLIPQQTCVVVFFPNSGPHEAKAIDTWDAFPNLESLMDPGIKVFLWFSLMGHHPFWERNKSNRGISEEQSSCNSDPDWTPPHTHTGLLS